MRAPVGRGTGAPAGHAQRISVDALATAGASNAPNTICAHVSVAASLTAIRAQTR
jgi:hypothetical protein